MKARFSKLVEVASVLVAVLVLSPTPANAVPVSFTFGSYLPPDAGNVLGLAVDPSTGNVFLTCLSYGGGRNLFQFTSDGTFVSSTRTVFDTGSGGNLGNAVIGRDGHLFIAVAKGFGSAAAERSVVEMSQDGGTIYSSFSTDSYFGGVFGITYQPSKEHLILASGRVGDEFLLRETLLDGTPVNTETMDVPLWPADIAFDPFSGHMFSIRGSSSVLDEYSLGAEVTHLNSYDLRSVGLFHANGLDINRSEGLFYANDNGKVVEFSLNDLGEYIPPAPPPPSSVPDSGGTATLMLAALGCVIGLQHIKRVGPGCTPSPESPLPCGTLVRTGSP